MYPQRYVGGIYCLCLAEEELLVEVFTADVVEADETGEVGDDFVAGKAGEADDLVEGAGLLEDVKKELDVVAVGEHGALGLLGLAPEGEVDGRGDDVLVVDADIGAHTAFIVEGADGALGGRGNCGDDDGPEAAGSCIRRGDMIGVELDAGLRLAVFVGGLVHHVDLFLAAYS